MVEPSSVSSLKWLALKDTRVGRSHVLRRKPNQDFCYIKHLNRGRSGIIVAVADGHGGDRYVRSGYGAEIAARTAVDYLQDRLTPCWTGQPHGGRLSLSDLQEEVPRYLLRRWRSQVKEHIALSPWTDEERRFGWQNALSEDAYTAYGTTLLFAAALPEFVLYGQLGDGDIFTVCPRGEVARAIPRSESSFANETLSFCSPQAEANMTLILNRNESSLPAMIFLATDGYSNSFKDEAGFTENIAGISQYLKQPNGYRNVERALPHWLQHCANSGSGDDVTVALAFPARTVSSRQR